MIWRATALTLALFVCAPAWSATITVTGLPGANGTPGGGSTPHGGPGSPGEAAVAVANDASNTNSATATGGRGGAGGDGANGGFMTPGGDGGNGAVGGAGEAIATTVGSGSVTAQASATATGGRGGNAGSTGVSSVPGAIYGTGGDGGGASATASATHASHGASADARATGGEGGFGSGFPPGGGHGGAAMASATADGSWAQVRADARGGRGAAGGDGGPASLGEVFGRATGSQAYVSGSAIGGAGGRSNGTLGGGAGASVVLVDAVDGESDGSLFLTQHATGGDGGNGDRFSIGWGSGAAGDATSRLTRAEMRADLLVFDVSATGGNAGDGGESPAVGAELRGGNAIAELDWTHADGDSSFGNARAVGGKGGAGGAGGDATSVVSVHASGVARIEVGQEGVPSVRPPSGAYGGLGGRSTATLPGGNGGNASSSTSAIADGSAEVFVLDQAGGGEGGYGGGRGGSARSVAFGSNEGASRVEVTAEATGGTGGYSGTPGVGGVAEARAEGISTGGGAVTVTAIQTGGTGGNGGSIGANGIDSLLVDAVRGSTTGQLVLIQQARSGAGGFAFDAGGVSGLAGKATSILHARNPGGGAIAGRSQAFGADYPGSIGGDAQAEVEATSDDAQAVEASALAQGGDGRIGGNATLGRVWGASAGGGDVRVIGEVVGGDGSERGATAHVSSAVDGATSGRLWLEQRARGGGVGIFASAANVEPGAASSALDRTFAIDALTLTSEAFGGDGARGASSAGATADASARGRNDLGGIEVRTRAEGGEGSFGGVDLAGGRGADATAFAEGTTSQHGAGVEVGLAPLPTAAVPLSSLLQADSLDPSAFRTGAVAGVGGGAGRDARGGDGGTASSTSRGVALGDAAVEVWDAALAGDAGSVEIFGPGEGGNGGHATSTAVATGAGDDLARAHAYARGGEGGDNNRYEYVDGEYVGIGAGGVGGNALAHANAQGLGDVLAEARADAGAGVRTTGGTARATAAAMGASGLASALATSSFDGVHGLRATTSVEVAGGASAQAQVVFGDPQPSLAGAVAAPDVVVDAVALPGPASLDAALRGNPSAAAAIAAAGAESVAVLAAFAARNDQAESSIVLSGALELDVAYGESLRVSFLDPEVTGGGFDTLYLLIERRGVSLVDQVFEDVSAALAYFDDHVLLFGGDPVPGRLRIAFEVTASAGDGFATDFLVQGKPVIVPEPSPAALLLLGLIALARRRVHESA